MWSADSRKLPFASSRAGDWEIYMTDLIGQAISKVTDNVTHALRPDWSRISGRAFDTSHGVNFDYARGGRQGSRRKSQANGFRLRGRSNI